MTDQDTNVDVEARRAIEAVVLVATEPVDPAVLAQLIEVPTARVEALCEELAAEYERDGRGFTIARIAGGYRFQTHPDAAPYVERFVLDGQHARLSGPALETLAIVAYKQPISRAQLSAIRGVNVDATLRTLVARGYVEEIGHDHSPGNPALFATTDTFLERLGLDSLEQLPSLGDFVPDASLVETLERGLRLPGEPTSIEDTDADADVSEDAGTVLTDVVVEKVVVEKFDYTEVNAIAAELQEGLDDD
jgi:segregation and condensation protein B